MRQKLIFSFLFLSTIVVAQSTKGIKPLDLFTGYNNFCVNYHEEGVVYMWYWDDGRTIMLSVGALSDLIIPHKYSIISTHHEPNIKIVDAQDTLSISFARKETITSEHTCVLYYNFLSKTSLDSMSSLLKCSLLTDDIK